MSLFLSGTFVWVLVCTILTSGRDSIENLTNFFNTSVVFFNFFTKYIFFSDRHDVKISSLFYWIFFFLFFHLKYDFGQTKSNPKWEKKEKKKETEMHEDWHFYRWCCFFFIFIYPSCLVAACCCHVLPPCHAAISLAEIAMCSAY